MFYLSFFYKGLLMDLNTRYNMALTTCVCVKVKLYNSVDYRPSCFMLGMWSLNRSTMSHCFVLISETDVTFALVATT
uniref:Uncharacterized protein n=1 Tax=Anguilla anguilla TaxID=7936 RepID=A0A0E9WYN6_ANGAN